MNVEPTGFANALQLDMRKGVKDDFMVFTSIVGWCYLSEMAKIVEGAVLSIGVKNQVFCGQIF